MKTKTMNLITWVLVSVILFGILLLWNSKAIGEEWTAEQKEVWEIVEADFEKFKKSDLEGLLASKHDDVRIWWGIKPIPFDKELLVINYRDWLN